MMQSQAVASHVERVRPLRGVYWGKHMMLWSFEVNVMSSSVLV